MFIFFFYTSTLRKTHTHKRHPPPGQRGHKTLPPPPLLLAALAAESHGFVDVYKRCVHAKHVNYYSSRGATRIAIRTPFFFFRHFRDIGSVHKTPQFAERIIRFVRGRSRARISRFRRGRCPRAFFYSTAPRPSVPRRAAPLLCKYGGRSFPTHGGGRGGGAHRRSSAKVRRLRAA